MKITGRVQAVFFRNEQNHYTVLKLATGRETVTVSGVFPLFYDRANLSCFGSYRDNKKYGRQFHATQYELLDPTTKRELRDFLNSELFLCGYQTAEKIAERVGVRYLEIYENYPLLQSKYGLDSPSYKELGGKLGDFYRKKAVLTYLIDMGVPGPLACTIAFAKDAPSLTDIQENPYSLLGKDDVEWEHVDRMAYKMGWKKNHPIRMEEGLYYLLSTVTTKRGHMCIPREYLPKIAASFLGVQDDVTEPLSTLLEKDRVYIDRKKNVYSDFHYETEMNLARDIFRIHAAPAQYQSTNPISFTNNKIKYSNDQQEAVELGMKHSFSIISGSAGTGKTTILVKLVEENHRLGYDIKLCAPTGRAAKRMQEVTGMEASTIHQLLLFNKETKQPFHTRETPLPVACYFIDESSMLDCILSAQLLSSIPNGSKVIFIGDVDQLPSVGPGNVLKDLIHSKMFPFKQLHQVYRQKEGRILNLSVKVKNGESVDRSLLTKNKEAILVERSNVYQIVKDIRSIIETCQKKEGFDPFTHLQVITPIHAGPLGTKALNKVIQEVVNPDNTKDVLFGDQRFRVGDRVIHLINDIGERGLVNGDIGKVIATSVQKKSVTVDFYGKSHTFKGDELFDLELAHALTVHKVQGGEYPIVIMPLHTSFGSFMLNRNLLYTAVTRAEHKLILFGEFLALEKSIENTTSQERYRNLLDRLKTSRLDSLFSS